MFELDARRFRTRFRAPPAAATRNVTTPKPNSTPVSRPQRRPLRHPVKAERAPSPAGTRRGFPGTGRSAWAAARGAAAPPRLPRHKGPCNAGSTAAAIPPGAQVCPGFWPQTAANRWARMSSMACGLLQTVERLAGMGIGTLVTFQFGSLKSTRNRAQSAGLIGFSMQREVSEETAAVLPSCEMAAWK